MMTCTAVFNPDFNSIEITFPAIPCAAVRNALKALRYRWHAAKKLWYGYTDMQTVADALTAAGVDVNPSPVAYDDCADEITAAEPTAPAVVTEQAAPAEVIDKLEIKHPNGVMFFGNLGDFFPMTATNFRVVLPLLAYVDRDTLRNFLYTLKLQLFKTTGHAPAVYLKRLTANIAAIEKRYPEAFVAC